MGPLCSKSQYILVFLRRCLPARYYSVLARFSNLENDTTGLFLPRVRLFPRPYDTRCPMEIVYRSGVRCASRVQNSPVISRAYDSGALCVRELWSRLSLCGHIDFVSGVFTIIRSCVPHILDALVLILHQTLLRFKDYVPSERHVLAIKYRANLLLQETVFWLRLYRKYDSFHFNDGKLFSRQLKIKVLYIIIQENLQVCLWKNWEITLFCLKKDCIHF